MITGPEIIPQLHQISDHERRGNAEIIAVLGIARSVVDQRPKMEETIKDVNIKSTMRPVSPLEVANKYPQTEESARTVLSSRRAIAEIITNPTTNNRLLVVVGPCSIHDPEAALEYAKWLQPLRIMYADRLEIVMRTYVEKPRTTIGWEGFVEDPHLDKSYDKDAGLLKSRKLLLAITELGIPVTMELLNTATPQYLDELISWGAIGARTVESQLHRKLASGVSFPVGFKNGTGGGIDIMINAIKAAQHSHHMDGIDRLGSAARIETKGNKLLHAILRGGGGKPNYLKQDIQEVTQQMTKQGLVPAVMVDCSHVNSNSDFTQQPAVAEAVAQQVADGNSYIIGAMIESNLVPGRQDVAEGRELLYGQSITDSCVGLTETQAMLEMLADSVTARRKNR